MQSWWIQQTGLVVLAGIALGACAQPDPRAVFSYCTSETTNNLGSVFNDTYDSFGWRTERVTHFVDTEPFTITTKYTRVASQVDSSITEGGGETRVTTYDAHEHVEGWTKRDSDGVETTIECTLTHDKDALVRSVCGELTVDFDACENPTKFTTESREVNISTSYGDGCIPVSSTVEGTDVSGTFTGVRGYEQGRQIAEIITHEDGQSAQQTLWDCPIAE